MLNARPEIVKPKPYGPRQQKQTMVHINAIMTCSSVFSLQSSLSFSVLWTPWPLPMERVVRRVNHLDFNESPLACHDFVIFVQFFFPSRKEDICAFFFFKSRAPKSKQTPLILISQKKKAKLLSSTFTPNHVQFANRVVLFSLWSIDNDNKTNQTKRGTK